jgi:GxxExxY protein
MEVHPKPPKGEAHATTDFSDLEQLIGEVIDHAFHLHRAVGPGLLEAAYETFLAASLREAGWQVEQQLALSATYRGTTVEKAFRIDLLINRKLIVEIKSVEAMSPVFKKQVLTYLRLTGLPVGLLINFNTPTFEGASGRVIDSRHPYQSQRKARS